MSNKSGRGWLLPLLAGVLLIVAGALIAWSIQPTPSTADDPAPMVQSPFTNAPTVVPSDAPTSTRDGDGKELSRATMAPDHILIPSLGVYAHLNEAPIGSDGLVLPIPNDQVSHYSGGGDVIGDSGTVLIAGHISYNGVPGALNKLAQIRPGSVIYTSDSDGNTSAWVVVSLEEYHKQELPQDIFTAKGERRLVAATCGGPIVWINGERHYRDNVVAYAVPLA